MRTPWVQIEMEVLEQAAAELAVEADEPGWDESHAYHALSLLFVWGLRRCRDDAPPSAQANVLGSRAEEHIARAARFPGSPQKFAEACLRISYPPIERIEGGYRMKGLSRYDALWRKNNPEAARAWAARTAPEPERNRAGTGAEPERVRTGSAPPDTDPDTTTPLRANIVRPRLQVPAEVVPNPTGKTFPERVDEVFASAGVDHTWDSLEQNAVRTLMVYAKDSEDALLQKLGEALAYTDAFPGRYPGVGTLADLTPQKVYRWDFAGALKAITARTFGPPEKRGRATEADKDWSQNTLPVTADGEWDLTHVR